MALEGVAGTEQAIQCLLIDMSAPALTDDGFVRVQAERIQRLELALRRARDFTRRVDVFDAHQPRSADVPRQQPASQGGEQGAEVRVAGGRGRETAAV